MAKHQVDLNEQALLFMNIEKSKRRKRNIPDTVVAFIESTTEYKEFLEDCKNDK